MATEAEINFLREKTAEAEKALGGQQVRWASTPKQVPALRKRGVLFSGVLGGKRYYAFSDPVAQELFVYDRHDTLFVTSADIRKTLGLCAPVFFGTKVKTAVAAEQEVQSVVEQPAQKQASAPAATPTPEKAKNRFRK